MKELTYKELVEADIFDLIGAPKSISKEEKSALILKMYQTIENRVIAKIMDRLSDEEIKEFDQKMQLGQKDGFEYLESKDINFNKLVLEESIILKTELTDLAQKHNIKH